MKFTYLASLLISGLSGLAVQEYEQNCVFTQATGPQRKYIVVLRSNIEQEEATQVIFDLEREIECQGGKVKHTYDFGGFHGFAATFPSKLTNSINSRNGPFGKYIKNIERDREVHQYISIDA